MRKVSDEQKLKEVRQAINYIKSLQGKEYEMYNVSFKMNVELRLNDLKRDEARLVDKLFVSRNL